MESHVILNSLANATPWLLPAVLLLLKFGLKLWVSEAHSGINLWKSVLQSPVDIGFLSLSLIASAIIKASGDEKSTGNKDLPMAFLVFLIYIFLIILTIVFWKASPTNTDRKDIIKAGLIAILNYGVTIAMLAFGVALVRVL